MFDKENGFEAFMILLKPVFKQTELVEWCSFKEHLRQI